jgi:hypothetical protein
MYQLCDANRVAAYLLADTLADGGAGSTETAVGKRTAPGTADGIDDAAIGAPSAGCSCAAPGRAAIGACARSGETVAEAGPVG